MKSVRLLICAAVFVLTACDNGGGVVRPPPTDLRVMHAAPNFNEIAFLREENSEAFLAFGAGEGIRFDSGQYDFHLENVPVGATSIQRPLNFSQTLSPDLDYTMVIMSPSGPLEVMVVTTPDEDPAPSMTRITIIHAHNGLGAFDVYIELAGTDLTTATARGSASFGPTPLVFEVSSEIYHMFLTAAGDPTNILFESTDLFITPDSDFAYVVSDPANQGFSPLMVTEVGANSRRIGDNNELSAVRFIHGVNDRLNRDIILENNANVPFLTSLPFGTYSAYLDITRSLHTVGLTPEGNNTTIEESFFYTAVAGRFSTVLFAGDASSEVGGVALLEDKRSITGQSTVSTMNIAGLFGAVEIFIEAPGTDISTESPLVTLIAPGFQERAAFVPGDYEVTIRDVASGSIFAGPIPVTMSDGGVYGLLLANAANGSSIDINFFDDSPP